jgi:hypothetical protein
VSSEYQPKFPFSGGKVVKVMFDVSDDVNVAMKRKLAVHHADRGAHYTSAKYQSILATHGMRCSMSRIANCRDNAVAESFFSTLKNEQTLHERYKTHAQARAAVPQKRGHSLPQKRGHSYLCGRKGDIPICAALRGRKGDIPICSLELTVASATSCERQLLT